ncbi:MAG TPA: PaaI family thioesterase [Burkholderiales bacterium]|nr:PaaI family thioesterase [Burkholderiales bacterium]
MPTFSAPNPDYRETVERLLMQMPYVAWLGLSFARIAPGEVELQMPHRHEITFDGNAVQAGPIGALLDFSGGSAAFTLVDRGVMLSTIDYSVKLLAPGIGQRFIGRGAVLSAGKSLIVSRADAFAVNGGDERLIATGLVTMRVVS